MGVGDGRTVQLNLLTLAYDPENGGFLFHHGGLPQRWFA